MGALVFYRVLDLGLYHIDLASVPILMLGWTGMLLGTIFLIQTMLSLCLDRPYDQHLLRNFFWMIWYPIIYWTLSASTSIVALPMVMMRKSGRRATWVSPDRGIAPK